MDGTELDLMFEMRAFMMRGQREQQELANFRKDPSGYMKKKGIKR